MSSLRTSLQFPSRPSTGRMAIFPKVVLLKWRWTAEVTLAQVVVILLVARRPRCMFFMLAPRARACDNSPIIMGQFMVLVVVVVLLVVKVGWALIIGTLQIRRTRPVLSLASRAWPLVWVARTTALIRERPCFLLNLDLGSSDGALQTLCRPQSHRYTVPNRWVVALGQWQAVTSVWPRTVLFLPILVLFT